MECPTCSLYKTENERLWHEVDTLLKMIENYAQVTEVIYEQGEQAEADQS